MKSQKGFSAVLLMAIGVGLLFATAQLISAEVKNNTGAVAGWSDFLFKQSTPKITGNAAPAGAHYNLNIIGVPKNKTAEMTGSSGHRIFVPLVGKCKINLRQGDFQVVDGS